VVAPAPNLTRVTGRVRSSVPSTSFDGWTEVEVVLDVVEPVPGLRSMVRSQPGDVVTLAVAPGLLPDDPVGYHLDCRASVTPNGLRCEPHPVAEHFGVSAPPTG